MNSEFRIQVEFADNSNFFVYCGWAREREREKDSFEFFDLIHIKLFEINEK